MYIIRSMDLIGAIDPKRKLVKLMDPNLWKEPWPEGIKDWQKDHEIRNDSIGISLFTTGTTEKLHYHERTWEIYQVLQGNLKIAVKPYRKCHQYHQIKLTIHDMIVLSPGTLHMVDSKSIHITQVIQVPPALTDQIVFPFNPNDPTSQEQQEIKAAENALNENSG